MVKSPAVLLDRLPPAGCCGGAASRKVASRLRRECTDRCAASTHKIDPIKSRCAIATERDRPRAPVAAGRRRMGWNAAGRTIGRAGCRRDDAAVRRRTAPVPSDSHFRPVLRGPGRVNGRAVIPGSLIEIDRVSPMPGRRRLYPDHPPRRPPATGLELTTAAATSSESTNADAESEATSRIILSMTARHKS